MHGLVASAAVVDAVGYTIDELARATGTTARTIRSYQDRGLLPPPVIVGRTGRYDRDHVARLRVISRLLDERFSLASIGALLHAWETGESLAHILGFVDDVAVPESPHDATRPEDGAAARLAATGTAPGRLSPAALVELGVPLREVLDEMDRLHQDCARITARFVALLDAHAASPLDGAEVSAARAAVLEALPGEVAAALRDVLPAAPLDPPRVGSVRHRPPRVGTTAPSDVPRVDDRTNERALGAIDLTGNAVIADLTADAAPARTVERPHTAR